MKPTIFSLAFVIIILSSPFGSFGHGNEAENAPRFSENKGQWSGSILYRLKFKTGVLFFEKDKLTYSFINPDDWAQIYHAHDADSSNHSGRLRAHAFKVHFENCNPQVTSTGMDAYGDYENYYIGNDPSNWASNVKVYHKMRYQNLYPGIDLQYQSSEGHLKYSYIVSPHSDPTQIKMRFEGVEEISVRNGILRYTTSVNYIQEEQLYAWQNINGQKIEIPCSFVLRDSTVSFMLARRYNPNYELVIDPVLVFSTYTGSVSDNFGFTATYDNTGHLYAGGIVFGQSYPLTTGAFDVTYNGGNVDVSITKFTPDGSNLVYSMFLGGSESENPSSIIVDNQDELIVLGTTSSSDFPTTVGAYDRTFNFGTGKNYPNNGPNFVSGTDIFVCKFNTAGSALVGSTFIGGSGNDGLNDNAITGSYGILVYNYGDQFRGEVILDAAGNIYASSSTLSTNFPTTIGAFQTSSGGGQDAVVFKFNSNLTSLLWSSYLGGSGADAGYNILTDNQNRVYVSGGTTSSNFPATAGSLHSTFQGGRSDGYIVEISAAGNSILSATYIGTNEYDQSYFIDQDASGTIYVVGQTDGNYPVTSGVYTNANSGQYLTALRSNLSSIVFSTVFGRGDGDPDISPTAFLVDNCNNIYLSGWAGNTLMSIVNPGAFNSTVIGLPITADAYQNTPDGTGSDFYFIVFGPNAASLKYGTYFGSPSARDHVDGGTSRFDKNGVIYQAVCAGCGGYDDFPYTPGAWSQDNASFNCNEGLAKFEFQLIGVDVDVLASPSTSGCTPLTVAFDGQPVNVIDFSWDFGDGTGSTLTNPTHSFSNPGAYTVTLVGIDSTTCTGLLFSDTSAVTISVFANPTAVASPDVSICSGTSTQLTAAGGISYSWSNNQTSQSINVSPAATTTYIVTVTDANSCTATDDVTVEVLNNISVPTSASICNGDSLFVGGDFQNTSGTYIDTLIAANGCDSIVSTSLLVLADTSITRDISICEGDSFFVGGDFQTDAGQYTDSLTGSDGCDSVVITNLTVLPVTQTVIDAEICDGDGYFAGGNFQTVSGTYYDTLIAANGCDSIVITNLIVNPNFTINVNVTICNEDSFFVGGANQNTSGIYYDTLLSVKGCDSVIVTNLTVLAQPVTTIDAEICDGDGYFAGGDFQTTSGTYYDTLTDANGCDSIIVTNLTVNPTFVINVDVTICNEDSFFVGGGNQNTSGIYYDTLSTVEGCDSVVVTNLTVLPQPLTAIDAEICDGDGYFAGGDFQTTSGTYYDTLTDANGCDSIIITNLVVNPTYVTNVDVTICNEDSFFVGGGNQNTSGVYYDTLSTAEGCDSVIATNLTVLPQPLTTIDAEICDGDGYFAGGDFQTISGTYYDTLTDANGCDSILVTNLIVNPTFVTNVDVMICNEDSFFVGGGNQNISGIYYDSLLTAKGCDSVIVTNLTVLPPVVTVIDTQVCDGTAYFAGGAYQTTSGTYYDTLKTAFPCDSVIITNLTFSPAMNLSFDVENASCFESCDGSITGNVSGGQAPLSFSWSNNDTTAQINGLCAASYDVMVTDANGCTASGSAIVNEPSLLNVTTDHQNILCNCVNQIADYSMCVIDFAGLPHGTILNEQYAAQGIHISGDVRNSNTLDQVIVFNSFISGSPDPDLQVHIGNLSILPNNLNDANGDGLIDVPDDVNVGGTQTFTFDLPRDVISFVFVDLDNNNPAFASAYDANNNLIKTVTIPNQGNASVQTVMMNASGVRKLVIDYRDSGGVTEIRLRCSFQCCDGWATALPAGGTPPYNFVWSNGGDGDTISNLCPGTYYLTVTDNNGCSLQDSVTIDDFQPIEISIVAQDLSEDCSSSLHQLCELNFGDLPSGTKLNEQYAQSGIHISGDAYGSFTDQLIIFDADASGTPDPDLETATGHLAIFPENLIDNNHDGLVDSPNDQGQGGKMIFAFDQDMTVISFIFVDKDNNNSGVANAYNANNVLIKSVNIPNAGDGSVQTLPMNVSGVRKLVFDYHDSGGVTDIIFGCQSVCCDGSASATVSGGNPPYNFEWSNGETTIAIDSLCPGTYTVTVTDQDSCQNIQSVDIFDCTLSISGLTIVRQQLGGDVGPLTDGMTISLDTLCPFNIRADLCFSPNGSIKFLLNGLLFSIEDNAPYALAGDNPIGSYRPWVPDPGDYTLVAIPYSEPSASGEQGRPFAVDFTVIGHACALKTSVNNTEEPGLSINVYPIPFEESFIVDLQVPGSDEGTLTVVDIIGMEVNQQIIKPVSGMNSFRISLGSQVPDGVYFLEVRISGQMKVVKVIKG